MIPMNIYGHSVTMQRSRNETSRVLWQYAQYQCIQCHFKQDKQCTYNVTLTRLRTTTVAVEKQ
jgi:predicted CxxxxCH...CXXCH cytochrome family protein